jgi:hypothetical protein
MTTKASAGATNYPMASIEIGRALQQVIAEATDFMHSFLMLRRKSCR